MIVPRFTQDRCVILSDSGVESLLACAMAHEQQQLSGSDSSILLPAWWESTQEIDLMISVIDRAVVRQAGVYALDIYPEASVYPIEGDPLFEHSLGAMQSDMLLRAAHIALRSGIRRVVWPIRAMRPEMKVEMDTLIEQVATSVDRALLAARLASLDADEHSAVEVIIETPFVDLTNGQVSDLASDLAIPLETCWWQHGQNLPSAQERFAYWSSMSLRSPAQVEPKPRPQTHA